MKDWRSLAWFAVALMIFSAASCTQTELQEKEITKRTAMELGYKDNGWGHYIKIENIKKEEE